MLCSLVSIRLDQSPWNVMQLMLQQLDESTVTSDQIRKLTAKDAQLTTVRRVCSVWQAKASRSHKAAICSQEVGDF
jgi:hypothetical protein